MSATRLTFLYPHLFRSGARIGEPSAQSQVGCWAAAPHPLPHHHHSRRKPAPPVVCPHRENAAALFTTNTPARQSTVFKRHGKAVEPLPLHSVSKTEPAAAANKSEAGTMDKGKGKDRAQITAAKDAAARIEKAKGVAKDTEKAMTQKKGSGQAKAKAEDAKAAGSPSQEENPSAESEPIQSKKGTSGPMDAILHMGPPPSSSSNPPLPDQPSDESSLKDPKSPPHLTPPPYVHHFDSYSLVKQLETGGWTNAQSITTMKAVRGLLAVNLSVAQAGLVSKSDVENETYLFRAACSELSTEVKNNRRVADEGMRQQRTLLQHEVDILTQRLSQELLTLNDNVRGMFNDRRMAVREEQKAAESAIQQINYKISVELNSDARSEVEGLRWVLIRRSVLGIVFMALLTLGSLRYASYRSHEKQKLEAERAAREAKEQAEHEKEKFDPKRDHATGPDAAEILAAN